MTAVTNLYQQDIQSAFESYDIYEPLNYYMNLKSLNGIQRLKSFFKSLIRQV